MLRILLLIVALAFPLPAYAWPGTVLDVHDGDTMTVAPMGDVRTPLKIRLYGIDAPRAGAEGRPAVPRPPAGPRTTGAERGGHPDER